MFATSGKATLSDQHDGPLPPIGTRPEQDNRHVDRLRAASRAKQHFKFAVQQFGRRVLHQSEKETWMAGTKPCYDAVKSVMADQLLAAI